MEERHFGASNGEFSGLAKKCSRFEAMAGTELSRYIDEDDAPRVSNPRRSSWDWNKICAYHTNRVVRIQDANLGYLPLDPLELLSALKSS